MPRTKQIHPRNLRDKIEEAQKQLNGKEDQQREITDSGTRGNPDTIKGVKRKKIVTENHLKKIPKSPLRNPTEAKVKQNIDPSPLKVLQDASEHATAQDHLPVQNGNQCTKQNGGVLSSEISTETTKSEIPMRTKLSSTHQSLDLSKKTVEDSDVNQLSLPEKKSLSKSLPSKTKTDSNECITFVDGSTSSPCTRTAFDVLLKAMEPELNTLAQECPPYGMQVEKLRPNKTVSTSASLVSNTVSVQNQSALSQNEFAAGPRYFPCTLNNVHVGTAAKSGQAQVQTISPSQDLVAKTSQQNHQVVVCPSFTGSVVQQQSQENPKLQQIYSIAVTSSGIHTSSSTVTQVFPQNQLVTSSSSPLSINTSSSTHLSTGPMYNSAQIASVVNHGVEQICNLLKDQKPKKLGKYVCEYCNRACAKPSVLQKHIRSHTGERPYPCVTCGFSFKTKSNLYKHKKSHAHAIKLGLVLQPDSGGLFLSHDSDKALSINSDVEESGESEDEGTADERQDDQELEPAQIVKVISSAETLQKESPIPLSNPDCILGDTSLHDTEPQVRAALPKVVVHPVSVSPLRADSPKVKDPAPELAAAQRKGDFKATNLQSNLTHTVSLKDSDIKQHQKTEMGSLEEQLGSAVGAVHAQLQRQQATDCSQEQQGKCLLSPRSLGSTDSGYFSRSESADQTMSPPAPFVRGLLTSEKDSNKSLPSVPRTSGVVASVVQTVCAEKNLILSGQMRPPMATKTLEERISKLISDNEAVVDDKQLDSVKPRRTSLSRRGSIDSPKSYIFKDSFQFDLKPMGRRTSSSSDIPKSPFTPTEKSKQVFLLSVPSLDCLPITRSNSMPTTSYSAVPPNVIPPSHPLRGSQSFDDKIGSLYDDVFVSGPATPLNQGGHTRTLVRQAAIEDSSTGENQVLGPARSVEESYLGCNLSNDSLLQRSKSLAQASSLEKTKKTPQVRGTMFECETCRNRYRKLENFENHKKFYCSELHGPKTKAAIREPEHKTVPNSTQPQILHYRVTTSTGVWEQTPQIRKRRKMKSVGDDDDPQQNDTSMPSKNAESQSKPTNSSSLSKHSATVLGSQQPSNLLLQSSQIQLVAQGTDLTAETKMSPLAEKQTSSVMQEKVELKRQGTGISVIQHTNSLSRNSSFEKSESFERVSPVSSQEPNKVAKHLSLNTLAVQEDRHSHLNASQHHQPLSSEAARGEMQGSQIVSNERSIPVQPSRLVRQHNIQVPEILVTEEPDRDQENQCSDQEKTERFNWPQRSETLSKLPTEKLPPKKKRIRLAEMEHSSAESSVDSTLSRSLSRESSLSHASSFSASLDKDEISKVDNPSKAELVSKSAEFLMIPAGSHVLGVPGPHYREMRRAASEQISCTQPSMEVDYRSKSFDCGSISPSKPASLAEVAAPKLSSGNGVTGHVPLLERRRGPFVRQISLNIAPESHPVKSTSSFQTAHAADVPFHRLQTSSKSLVKFPSSTQHLQTHSRPHSAIQNCNPGNTSLVQQPLDHVLNNQGQTPSMHQLSQTSTKKSAQGEQVNTNTLSCHLDEKRDCFAPKYQLQVKTLHIGQPYSSKLLKNNLSSQSVSSHVGADQNMPSFELQAKLSDSMSNPYSVPPLKQIIPNNCNGQLHQIPPFVVPVRIHSSMPSYGFATVTPLPHILVTQDQVSQSASKTNAVMVPTLESKAQLPKSHKDHKRTLPNSFEFENPLPESGTRNLPLSSSLNIIQKVPVSGLFPQQEATASSKRMLSPANSLDIAMEKQQKRVKDESGAACMTEGRPLHPLNVRSNDPTGKQKKPVLVRQVCTTEPLENHLLDPDGVAQHEKSSKASTSDLLLPNRHSSETGVSETLKESSESEDLKSSASPVFVVRKPSEPSPVSSQNSIPKAVNSSQERRSPGNSHESELISSQGQAKLLTTLAVMNAGEMQRLSFPSLKTSTSFTWCYLLKRKPLHLLQNDQKISAYSTWTISPSNPNPLGLSTKVALSLLNSKQKVEKPLYTQARTTHPRSDILVYSSKWKNSLTKRALNRKKITASEFSNKESSESSTEHDKENSFIKSEPRRVKIFDGGYKSNEDYVYVRGRGRGKYICEECGIRCKKPSMLKKHIRTHTDVRPYHCNYCNFSFKTKGNLTKHMKSKAHSKKCMDLGVSVGLIDDQDGEEEFGEKQRLGCDRSGFDAEESDGADEDENDNEDDDEDSQAESVLSTTPSVTASPQHHPSRHGLQDATSADEDSRLPDCFGGIHTDSMDGLPKALLTKMTVLSAAQSVSRTSRSPAEFTHQEENEDKAQERGAGPHSASTALVDSAPASPGRHMSVDYPDPETTVAHSSVATTILTKSTASASSPSSPADQSLRTTTASPYTEVQEEKPPSAPLRSAELRPSQTHLFSHLPLHSQQQAKAPYSMVPVGGLQVVPAGLATELQAVLEQLLEPDNAVIQQATARLREAFADPRTPERLAEIVVGAARPQLRQLAAVLLRRCLSGGRWRHLDPELRLRLPSLLAEALEKETDRSVLPSLSHVGAVLLRRGGAEAWAPMGQWVQRAARDPHLQERALQVLSAALEDPPPSLTPHCRPIAELCRGGLQPGTPPHSTAYALKALGGLAAALGGTQTDLLRSLLPDVLRALQALIDADEELGAAALEVLDEFVAADPKAVTFDLRPVLDLCLQVGGAEGRGQAVRARALAVLGFLAQERPRALQPFLPPLLGSLLTLLCSPPPRDHPDPEDAELWGGGEGGRSIRHCAAQVLNALALGVPAEKLLREMVPRLEPLLGSPEPWGRKGALLALGAAADGCGELLRRRYMGAVLGALRRGLRDPEGAVRGAAASALRSVGEYMQPEAAALALEALPAALEALPVSLEPLPGCPEALPGSPEVLPGARSWFVLRELLAVAGAAVAPQLGAVLGALLGVLERGRPHEMELALSALHELGGAVEDFPLCPPGGAVEAALLAVLRLPDPPHRAVRLQAMEVLGALGGGAAALEAVLEMAADGDGEERRVLFGLCGAAAEALREGVEPMLPRLLPLLLHSLQAPPPAASPAASDSFLLFDAAEDEEGAEPMGDEEEELVAVEVGGDFVAEVEAACEGAGLMAEHCGAAFEPYFCPTLEALLPLLEFPHPDVRSAAYGALGGLSCGAGNAVGQQELQGRALTALLGAVRAEKGAGPARAGLTALSRALSPALSPQLLHAIGCLMADVINGQIRCLQDDDGSDEEEVEAAAELRELAGEGLAAVGGASPGGGALSDSFRRALPTLLGCLNGDAAQRSWAAAILGEAGAHLERGVASELLPLIGPALARSSAHDPDPEVRSNALCSIGRLAANGVALGAAWPGLAAIGRALREEGRGRGRDNACGALVRHKGALPDAELLALLLPALPLTEDFEENSAVFGYLLQLQPEQLLPHAEEMPRVCSAIGTGSGDTDLEAAVVGLLQELWRRCPTDVGRGMERLPHSDSVRLRRAMGLDDAAAMTPSTVQ